MATIVDVPRTGGTIWLLLAGLLIPPAGVTFLGRLLQPIPHQTSWVIALGVPAVIMLLSLPRRYKLDAEQMTIEGFVYRVRIPLKQIVRVKPVGLGRGLMHPGSVFCSDPARALLVERKGKRALVISPADPRPFLALNAGGEPKGVSDA